MALKNGKSLKTTLKIFFKEHARYPEFEEFRNLVKGKNSKMDIPETENTDGENTNG